MVEVLEIGLFVVVLLGYGIGKLDMLSIIIILYMFFYFMVCVIFVVNKIV